jgi:DNA-binding transcriptional regulator YhcF (GntR family)
MRITINVNAQAPVFAQLIDQIRSAVQSGELKPGAALPAIRQLAADLQINPNTVAKAYALLERDAVIETRGRAGTHASTLRHRPPPCSPIPSPDCAIPASPIPKSATPSPA